ncbi:MAG: rRNA maturation RNase YbeY [Pseudomonadota bacterium]
MNAADKGATADEDDHLAGPPTLRATLLVEAQEWRAIDVDGLCEAVLRAVAEGEDAPDVPATLDVVFAGDERIAALNGRHRGKDAPTNVLAFPSGEEAVPGEAVFLGGIVLAWGQLNREAQERNRPLTAHATHLTLHGLLHLLGHDHLVEDERLEMERREIAILEGLGIADPYEGS